MYHAKRGVPISPSAIDGYTDTGDAATLLEGRDESGHIRFRLIDHVGHDSGVVYFSDTQGSELAHALGREGMREVFYQFVAREEWVIEVFADPVIDAFYAAADSALLPENE